MISISPLSDVLGAEVVGVDFQAVTQDDVERMTAAFLQHHLLCVRAPPLSPGQFEGFAEHFGVPQTQLIRSKRDGDVPSVSMLDSTYQRPEDKPVDLELVRLSGWHTDDSYFAKPAKATVLQSLAIPSSGGQTKFLNTRRAWESAPVDLRDRLRGRRAVHQYDTPRAKARAEKRSADEHAETPDVVHPLVRIHEESAIEAIYFNPNRTDRVLGLTAEESSQLLDELHAYLRQEAFQYVHEWRVGDILLWDNRCLLHAVNTDYPVGESRRHQRILLRGATPR
ncbi:MAG: TauD/TfdA family dioxygenase [Pseudomonadota bacterium]